MNLKQFLKDSKLNGLRHILVYNWEKHIIKNNPRRYAEKKYIARFNKLPDLDNPTTFNEKVLWISLYYHNPLYTKCADKVAVKDYLTEKLGEEANKLICERYGVWDNVDKIDFDKLPESFVLKSNHASAQYILCKNKKELNIEKAKKRMRSWLSVNYYYISGEWQYKNIKPQIICEKLLQSDIVDYRIFCFEGAPTYIKTTRHNASSKGGYDSAIYYTNWKRAEFKMEQNYGDMEVEKPKRLDYMLETAKKLSKDFHFVRVDLYSVGDEIYFAELTFTPNSGCEKYESLSIDEKFGSMFELPNDEFVKKEGIR